RAASFVSKYTILFFFSSRRRHTSFSRDWSSDVCSSDLSAMIRRFSAVFEAENRRIIAEGGEPASGRPVLMGITKASLATESWLRSEERRVGKEVRARWSPLHRIETTNRNAI